MNDDNIYYFAVRWILYISKQQQDFVRILYTDFSTKYFWKTNFTLVCVFFYCHELIKNVSQIWLWCKLW